MAAIDTGPLVTSDAGGGVNRQPPNQMLNFTRRVIYSMMWILEVVTFADVTSPVAHHSSALVFAPKFTKYIVNFDLSTRIRHLYDLHKSTLESHEKLQCAPPQTPADMRAHKMLKWQSYSRHLTYYTERYLLHYFQTLRKWPIFFFCTFKFFIRVHFSSLFFSSLHSPANKRRI